MKSRFSSSRSAHTDRNHRNQKLSDRHAQAKSQATPTVGRQLSTWLKKPKNNLIGGKWVRAASEEVFDVFNPADGSVIARVPDSDHEDIDRAVAAARRAFETGPWPRTMPSQR